MKEKQTVTTLENMKITIVEEDGRRTFIFEESESEKKEDKYENTLHLEEDKNNGNILIKIGNCEIAIIENKDFKFIYQLKDVEDVLQKWIEGGKKTCSDKIYTEDFVFSINEGLSVRIVMTQLFGQSAIVELTKYQEMIKPKEEYTLNLKFSDNVLWVKIGDVNIASLNERKIFRLFKDDDRKAALSKWREGDMKVDDKSVKVFGKEFDLHGVVFRECISSGSIFNFREMNAYTRCLSDAVLKWDGCNTPIIH